jgi:epoxyqueuosine reductase QueG
MELEMKEKISNHIKEFVANYNLLNKTETQWDEPLIVFADANDPMFLNLKKIVSSSHALPTDFIEDAKTVITFYIPFKEEVNISNVKSEESSHEWATAYIETNKLITDLNTYIFDKLAEANYDSTKLPPTHNFDKEKLISNWSHKHIAYIAGLGKFGLHQMLITEKGCSGRIGSIVINLEIEPTRRQEKEYCLFRYNKTCKKCIEKCVDGALKVDSFDRHKCYERCLINAKKHSELGLADICGKCISKVPCAFINPCARLTK